MLYRSWLSRHERGGTATDLLLDTDVLVEHLRGARRLQPASGRIAYSAITRCELFAGANRREAIVHSLLEPLTEIVVDRAIAETAGRLRRRRGTHMADALIAATAIQHGLTLVTRNLKGYRGIPGLKVDAPR